MGEFTMPTLGADMERGTLVEWRVAPGDTVQRGDIIAVVDTDKADIEVEVFESGRVAALLVDPGAEVEVGTPLARIETEADGVAPAAPAPPPPTPAPAAPAPAGPPPTADEAVVSSPLVRRLAERLDVDTTHLHGSGVGHRVTRADVEAAAHAAPTTDRPATDRPATDRPATDRPTTDRPAASPKARRLAAERGIDLTTVGGSGPDGAVRAADLEAMAAPAAAPTAVAATPSGPGDRAATMRRAIARLMTTANRDIPHYHVTSTVDVQPVVDWLATRNEGRPPSDRLLPAAVFLRAAVGAALRHPQLNGHWIDDAVRPAPAVDLAVAISLRGGGLVAPVITDAGGRSLEGLMAALRDLVERARAGALRSSEMGQASITVTNLGERGADSVAGVIHPPQVALLGIGRIVRRPWIVDDELLARSVVTLTLSGDHRATDGATGSAFLATVERLLSRPADLGGPAADPHP